MTERLIPKRLRGGRRKGEKPAPLMLAPIWLMRLFDTDDIEVVIRKRAELGVWCQVRRVWTLVLIALDLCVKARALGTLVPSRRLRAPTS